MYKTKSLKGLPKIAGPGTRILILGSFPGKDSLKKKQYYGNLRNQFWNILGLDQYSYEQRKEKLREQGIGIWDVIGSCRREGSSDSNIKDHVANDLKGFLRDNPGINKVLLNGKTAGHIFKKFDIDIEYAVLPSTSPANAAMSLSEKRKEWKKHLRPIK